MSVVDAMVSADENFWELRDDVEGNIHFCVQQSEFESHFFGVCKQTE